ncbi:uncharacterized protein LOC130673278 [Microplitis mediator]|uniref:uncharacterized protein LOC130673278 n=1 Tax=Microplitis mediator TaxID=375433 RepID=UPI0025543664|nr:uncharacterized protein LOC130673278 [Microplitis mediator]
MEEDHKLSKESYATISSVSKYISKAFAHKYKYKDKDNSSWYLAPSLTSRFDSDTSLARSYYGYGTPAFYSTFDPISVLASLAFLAFLLQSFMSLFDRSRSIIPAIVTSRSVSRDEVPDPIKLIMQALDEYEIFNDKVPDKKERDKNY